MPFRHMTLRSLRHARRGHFRGSGSHSGIVPACARVPGLPRARRRAGNGGGPGTDDRRRWFASSPRSADHRVQAGPCSGGRQDEPDRASRKRSCQSGVDCGYLVVVPFGYASHADRVRADGQAAAVDPPRDARRRFHAVRRADEGARGSDRRTAWPRQSPSVSQINFRVLVPAPQHHLPRVPRLLTFALRRRHSVVANAVADPAGEGAQDAADESGVLVVLDLPQLVDGPCVDHTMLTCRC